MIDNSVASFAWNNKVTNCKTDLLGACWHPDTSLNGSRYNFVFVFLKIKKISQSRPELTVTNLTIVRTGKYIFRGVMAVEELATGAKREL